MFNNAQIIIFFIHLIGVLAALDAIMKGRTSQGSIAWVISLVIFPYLALPLYWIFGSRRFHGYVNARRAGDLQINKISHKLKKRLEELEFIQKDNFPTYHALQKLARIPITDYNQAKLLVNGDATFDAIFKGIDNAKKYIIIQFYKITYDGIGKKLKKHLIKQAKNGIKVYFLYDDIGCHKLPKSYFKELRHSGVQVSTFKTFKWFSTKMRLNFRNHRKIVVIDGIKAFVGGFNVSDKYLGIDPKFGFWRDTHVQINGPSVQCIQLPFISDWFWATKKVPKLDWEPKSAEGGNTKVLTLPTGPDDEMETCGLFFVQAINSAKKRLWLVSPYFVPDEQVLTALQLAGLRGVDVRLIIPEKSDLKITYYSSFSYLKEITKAGVKVYRYTKGFLHQKVMLIDDNTTMIGTANLDNRSFRINFEINMLFFNKEFAKIVEDMIKKDLADSYRTDYLEYKDKPLWFKLIVRISRLLAPLQ